MHKSLNQKEHNLIISKIKSGDKLALEKYLLYFKPYIENLVNSLGINENYKEDALQAGYEGVLRALYISQSEAISRIYIHIKISIVSCLVDYIEVNMKNMKNRIEKGNYKNNIWLIEKEFRKNELKIRDCSYDLEYESLEDIINKKEVLDDIYSFIKTLDEREKSIFCSSYKILGYDLEPNELQQKYNVSRQRINQIKYEVLVKLKERYFLKYLLNKEVTINNFNFFKIYKETFFLSLDSKEDLKQYLTFSEIEIFNYVLNNCYIKKVKFNFKEIKTVFLILAKVLKWEYNYENLHDMFKDLYLDGKLTLEETNYYYENLYISLIDIANGYQAKYFFVYFLPKLIKIKLENDLRLKR